MPYVPPLSLITSWPSPVENIGIDALVTFQAVVTGTAAQSVGVLHGEVMRYCDEVIAAAAIGDAVIVAAESNGIVAVVPIDQIRPAGAA